MNISPEMVERFWAKVDKSGDCWEWTAYTERIGYGKFGVGGKRTALAHRVSWYIAHGFLPADMCVCHRCDNRKCVRPDHLFLGSIADNARDKAEKGRSSRLPGEMHPRAILSEVQVREIRRRFDAGERCTANFAKEFGVGPGTLYAIGRRRIWKHLT